jgi:hypothetical protein
MFYTYLWLRYDGTPFYVGKGTKYRAFVTHTRFKLPSKENIILQEFENEEDSLVAEKFLVQYYGRINLGTGCLRNFTDGGEGVLHPSPILRHKLRTSHLGHRASEETKKKMSVKRLGMELSQVHMNAIREVAKRDDVRKKKSLALKNKPWSERRRKAHKPSLGINWYTPYSKWRVRDLQGKHVGYFVTWDAAKAAAFASRRVQLRTQF